MSLAVATASGNSLAAIRFATVLMWSLPSESVQIFALDRDVVGDGVFSAAADGPAHPRRARAALKEGTGGGVEHIEVRAAAAVGDFAAAQ